MKRNLRYIVIFLPMAVLFVLFQQCSGVSFQNANIQSQQAQDCAQNSSKCKVTTERFNAGTSNKKIDFVWIVDNSASMSQEIQTVKDNMAAFATQLGSYTDLKMVLLSAKDDTTNPKNKYQSDPHYITMPNMPSNVDSLQINTLVRSRDALILGGLGICPPSPAPDSWCMMFQTNHIDAEGKTIPTDRWDAVYSTAISKLSSFVREQSHKVFVIVSDDDATTGEFHVKSNEFLNAYDSKFHDSEPIVYSIVSPRTVADANKAGCSVWNQGLEHMKLSALTGGETFDICAKDWTPYFDKMLSGISTLANTSFPLAAVNIVDILSVKVNGHKLNLGDYTYDKHTLSIRPDVMGDYINYNIEVEILEYTN